MLFSQKDKEEFVYNHFSSFLGEPTGRRHTLDWEALGIQASDLSHLEEPFSVDEVHAIIKEMHSEKAPGPDGFIGLSFKSAWQIVQGDLLGAVNFFFHVHDHHFKFLNSAHIVLIPKMAAAKCISDFRPISLTHNNAKFFSKLLANRLAPCLDQLVSRSQCAFIKRRSIHDNFLYAQNLIRELHRSKTPSLFLKLDIAKAFDSVRWDFLLELMQHLGFGPKWRAWVTILLKTTSSAVLINGARGSWFQHGRGLRKGDPLSPLLFIIAIDPLQRCFNLATQNGLLTPLQHRAAKIRVSFYADDAAIFLNPVKEEVNIVQQILTEFGEATGLVTNLNKSVVFPISCLGVQLQDVMEAFPCEIKFFPYKYLGLPLNFRPLRRVDFQPLIDKLGARLTTWRGRLLDKAGRLTLVNSVLSAIPVHFLTIFPLKKWASRKVDKIRRAFLWRGSDSVNGGHCLVNWLKVSRPRELGGLGVLDLDRFSRALRVRWLWYQWVEDHRLWVSTNLLVTSLMPRCSEQARW